MIIIMVRNTVEVGLIWGLCSVISDTWEGERCIIQSILSVPFFCFHYYFNFLFFNYYAVVASTTLIATLPKKTRARKYKAKYTRGRTTHKNEYYNFRLSLLLWRFNSNNEEVPWKFLPAN